MHNRKLIISKDVYKWKIKKKITSKYKICIWAKNYLWVKLTSKL